MNVQCSKRTCAIVRQHYLRPEARARFVGELVKTYNVPASVAKAMAETLAMPHEKDFPRPEREDAACPPPFRRAST